MSRRRQWPLPGYGWITRSWRRQELVDAEAMRQRPEHWSAAIEAETAGPRHQLIEAARQLGLLPVGLDPDQSRGGAVDEEAILAILREGLQEDSEHVDLAPLSAVLRGHYPYQIRDDRAVLVVRHLDELRQGETP